ncbi:serine/threonine-protein kinase Nek1 [Nematolebias whitei]|uniref:serine/threonine-protein kinase Nek1 n=1 Tax=Nematolebias whitei TaxID=451745 RepID=UPI00189A50C4|nr:serine/threonine-protein kinase Nek1 [Nematolebias whitei]
MFLMKAEQVKRYEKEKITRINQAREQGWKHVLSSSGGSSPEKMRPYEHYHAALDQMSNSQHKTSREGVSAGPGSPSLGLPAAAGPVLPNGPAQHLNPEAIKRELHKLQHVSKKAYISRQRGQMVSERAFQIEEFLQRKREAMLNKVRAEGQLVCSVSMVSLALYFSG